mmetsp:Transcript_20047/g.38940  ORF Transcript_20047/g.38940 Transcript_20047/m.38940 type:complete len:224 (-) Transcript_20047:324-995(-)
MPARTFLATLTTHSDHTLLGRACRRLCDLLLRGCSHGLAPLEFLDRHAVQRRAVVEQPRGHLRAPRLVRRQAVQLEALPPERSERRSQPVLVLARHGALQGLNRPQDRLIHLPGVGARHAHQVRRIRIPAPPVWEYMAVVPAPGSRILRVSQILPNKFVHILIGHFLQNYAQEHLVAQVIRGWQHGQIIISFMEDWRQAAVRLNRRPHRKPRRTQIVQLQMGM